MLQAEDTGRPRKEFQSEGCHPSAALKPPGMTSRSKDKCRALQIAQRPRPGAAGVGVEGVVSGRGTAATLHCGTQGWAEGGQGTGPCHGEHSSLHKDAGVSRQALSLGSV